MRSIQEFYEGSTILITGCTGFLGKVLVEKILRVLPNIRKLYLLLRPSSYKSPNQRLHEEVIESELFRVLKEKLGTDMMSSFISEKIKPIFGDIAFENLGIEDPELREEMYTEIDIIISSAATTRFDERYDVAMTTNTKGVVHLLNFAHKCPKIKALLHVSTAFVSGEKIGLIPEEQIRMGETLNGGVCLDIEEEEKLISDTLTQLKAQGATEKTISFDMKDLGLQRARKHGWPNTYTFTKAMGEMLIGHLKGTLPVIILRPPIITSTYEEPFPGWIESIRVDPFRVVCLPFNHGYMMGSKNRKQNSEERIIVNPSFRTVDAFIVSVGKGKLKCILGDPESTIYDLVPCDMVVNIMLVALFAQTNNISKASIYHASSSKSNPLKFKNLYQYILMYFLQNPYTDPQGKSIKIETIRVFKSMKSFKKYMNIHFISLLKVLRFTNTMLCHALDGQYLGLKKRINLNMRMADLYEPYLFCQAIYDDGNAKKLRILLKEKNSSSQEFSFDTRYIQWEEYFEKIHIPGVVKFLF